MTVPVTLVTGFIGAGKSAVLNHILDLEGNRGMAALSCDVHDAGIDPDRVRGAIGQCRSENAAADAAGCDYLLLESSGISEPRAIANLFSRIDKKGCALEQVARLDTIVTVVDAAGFLGDYEAARDIRELLPERGRKEGRNVAQLLAAQVEFCNVILVNKTDLVSTDELSRLRGILRGLNHEAKILETVEGQVSAEQVTNTGAYDFERMAQAAGWLRDIHGKHLPAADRDGVNSCVYRARRPFHPRRFFTFLNTEWPPGGRLIRSRGFFWLASRPDSVGLWNQAGGLGEHSYGGMFWKAVPESKWPGDEAALKTILDSWQEPFGDMRQELVFIGLGLNPAALRRDLDACLLNDRELEAGKQLWLGMDDPFPPWRDGPAEESNIH